jgi:hypothetical protein
MSKQAASLINKSILQHRKWLARNDSLLELEMPFFERAMQDDTLTALGLLANSVESIGLFYGTRGVVSQQDNINVGWSDMVAALECFYWSSKLELKSYYSWYLPLRVQRRTFLLGSLPRAVAMFCHAIATGDKVREQELWSLLEKPLLDDDPAVGGWWYERRFEPLVVSLYAKVRGQPIPLDLERCHLGVYGPILAQWEDDEAVAAALHKVCDYHLRRTENTRSRDAEFDRPPLDLIPFEVFAVNRLRADSGLRPVEVDHPLMHAIGPVVQVPPPMELMEILSHVQEKYNEFYRE